MNAEPNTKNAGASPGTGTTEGSGFPAPRQTATPGEDRDTERPSKTNGKTNAESDVEERAPLPKRVRLSIERTWEEAQKLSESILDVFVVPPSGFAATAIGWITTCFFFAVSLAVGGVLGLGALVLFVGLECLVALAYAYPAALFLLSVAGGIVPPLVLYWGIHVIFGIEGPWGAWGFYPLILSGAWGSYYYWRFGRVISTTGDGVLAFYRGAAPKAGEVFGLPFLMLSGVWDVLKLVFGLFRATTREFFKLFLGRKPTQPGARVDNGVQNGASDGNGSKASDRPGNGTGAP